MPIPAILRSTPAGISQDRQRRLLMALMDAGDTGLTRTQMGKLFGGQVRGVERALNALQAKGAAITATYPPDGSRHKRFVLTSPPKDATWPTPDGCLAHRVAEATLRCTGGSAWVDLHPARTFFPDPGLGPKATQRLARATDRAVVRGTSRSAAGPTPPVLSALTKVLSEPFPPKLELGYRAAGREADRIHQVVPHVVLQDAFASGTYLVAWDVTRQRVVVFRVSRIVSIRVVGPSGLSTAAQEALRRAAHLQVGAWTNAEEEAHRVRVRITEPRWAQHFMATTPDLPEATVEADPDHPEGVLITFLATAPEGAVRWILQLGAAAEVLEPPSIRDAVMQELDRAAQRYRTAPSPSNRP